MERRKCKLCFCSFSDGRALGGHMRCHFAAAAGAAVKPLLSDEVSASTSSREAETVLQVRRDSETESSHLSSFPAGIHRRRSKRPRPSSSAMPEMLSSESDVAICLMMLSRDVCDGDEDGTEEEHKVSGRFQCRSCKKIFSSYQALGGHRANHRKSPGRCTAPPPSPDANDGAGKRKAIVHECPLCLRVFTSGHALGGHKRSHLPCSPPSVTITSPAPTSPPTTVHGASKLCKSLFTSGEALGGHKRSHLPCSPPSVTITSPAPTSPPTTVHGASKLCKSLFDLNLRAPPDHEDAELRMN